MKQGPCQMRGRSWLSLSARTKRGRPALLCGKVDRSALDSRVNLAAGAGLPVELCVMGPARRHGDIRGVRFAATEFLREAVIKPGLIALLLCAPMYYVFWKAIFGSRQEFLDALRFWFQPNWLSLLRAEFNKDMYMSFKLGFFLFLCSACTWLMFSLFK